MVKNLRDREEDIDPSDERALVLHPRRGLPLSTPLQRAWRAKQGWIKRRMNQQLAVQEDSDDEPPQAR